MQRSSSEKKAAKRKKRHVVDMYERIWRIH